MGEGKPSRGEAIDGGHLTGERAEAGGLNVALMRGSFQMLVVATTGGKLLPQAVDGFGLGQHAPIRAGKPRESEHPDQRRGDKHVYIAHGDRDTIDLAVLPLCDVDDGALAHRYPDPPLRETGFAARSLHAFAKQRRG